MAELKKVMASGWADGALWAQMLEDLANDLAAHKAKLDEVAQSTIPETQVPSLVKIAIADGSTEVTHTFTRETTIVDVWFNPAEATGSAGTNTIQLKKGAENITDAMDIADTAALVRASTVDTTQATVDGDLTITCAKAEAADKNGGELYLLCSQPAQVPVLIRTAIASGDDGAGRDVDIEMDAGVEVLDAFVITTAATLNNDANTIQLKDNAGDNITEALDIRNKADKLIVRFTTIDTTKSAVDKGDNLTATMTKANNTDSNACVLVVLGRRVGWDEVATLNTTWSSV